MKRKIQKLTKINTKIKKANPIKLYAYWMGIAILSILILALVIWATFRPMHGPHSAQPGIEIAAMEQPYETMMKSQKHFNKGMKKMNKHDYRGAISEYNKAIKLNNNSYQYFIGRADAALGKGEAELAMSDLSRAVFLLSNEVNNQSIRDAEVKTKLATLANILESRAILKSENGDTSAEADIKSSRQIRMLLNNPEILRPIPQVQQQGQQMQQQMHQERKVGPRSVPVKFQGPNGESKILDIPEGATISFQQAN